MRATPTIVAATALGAVAGAALGQAGWLFTTRYAPGQTSVNPQFPTVTIRVSAYFAPNDYAIAGVNLNYHASEVGWVPGSNHTLAPFTTNGPGVISGPSILGNIGGQLNFPPAGIYADPSNPAAMFEADWRTTDFRRRSVSLRTQTFRFDVYPDRNSPASQSRMSTLMEGAGEILVTPAPHGVACVGLAAAAACRRKRVTP